MSVTQRPHVQWFLDSKRLRPWGLEREVCGRVRVCVELNPCSPMW